MDVKKLPLDERAQCAAYMRAHHNMSQVEIGKTLGGLSQPHVSRLLAHAKAKNYLVISQRFATELFTPDWLKQMDELLAPPDLTATLQSYCESRGYKFPSIRVYESGTGQTEGALSHRRSRFGRTAAGRLSELLGSAHYVGVAWGRTIKSLIDGIQKSDRPLQNPRTINFLPVCAEFVALSQRGYSSSRLAEALDDIFNGGQGEPLNMTGFPAFIPRHYDDNTRSAIRKFVSDTPSYAKIFSGPKALVNNMDMLITSVGSAQTPLEGILEELTFAGRIKADDLRQLIVGDLGGILIPRPDISSKDRGLVNDLNTMWTGMSLPMIREIAGRAHSSKDQTGVVVAALQAERADTIFELIRQELVNELIIDQAAANRLNELLKSGSGD